MVTFNGEQREIAGKNLYQYMKDEGYDIGRVVVEINLEIIPGDALEGIVIRDGDSIEVLHFVGGG